MTASCGACYAPRVTCSRHVERNLAVTRRAVRILQIKGGASIIRSPMYKARVGNARLDFHRRCVDQVRVKPRPSGRGRTRADTAQPSIYLCSVRRSLLLDVLTDHCNGSAAAATGEIGWRPKRTSPQFAPDARDSSSFPDHAAGYVVQGYSPGTSPKTIKWSCNDSRPSNSNSCRPANKRARCASSRARAGSSITRRWRSRRKITLPGRSSSATSAWQSASLNGAIAQIRRG